jgi:hypothetical protein
VQALGAQGRRVLVRGELKIHYLWSWVHFRVARLIA